MPKIQVDHINNSNNTKSKSNTCVKKSVQLIDAKNIVTTINKPNAHTPESKTITKSTNNGDQNNALKLNSKIKRWNRMARNSPKELLKDPDVRRWHDNLRRSSTVTCSVRLSRLNLFCDRINMTPQELIKNGKDDPMSAENILLDHVSWMEEKKYAPGYIKGMMTAVKSWLEYNHVEIKRKIKITNMDIPTTIQDEKVPDREQIQKILDAADPRGRVIMSLMAFAGVRPQVMGLADRSDGLVLSDLPDLILDGKDTHFERIPAMVIVRPQLSKIRKKYFTFLGEKGCQYVLGYLRERTTHGERLKSNTPLVTVDHGYRLKGWNKLNGNSSDFMNTNAMSSAVRPIIWSVTKVRPYALRTYFDSQLLIAESHGVMTHAYRQFFMGHKGDMEARYTTNKGKLTEQMTEDMRRAFEQSQTFLDTDVIHDAETDKRKMLMGMWRQQAKMYGLNIDAMLVDGTLEGAMQNAASSSLQQQQTAIQNSKGQQRHNNDDTDVPLEANNTFDGEKKATVQQEMKSVVSTIAAANNSRPCPFESRIVEDDNDLLQYTAEGWDLVKDLPGERFLIRRKIPKL